MRTFLPLFAGPFLALSIVGCSSDDGATSASTQVDAGAPGVDAGGSDAGASPTFPTTDLSVEPACAEAGCLRAITPNAAASVAVGALSAFAPAGTVFENGMKAFTVTYLSAANDEVTGTLFVPDVAAPAAGFPAVLLSQPTTGIGPKCAPSLGLLSTAIAAHVASRGFVVLMPDAPSFGAPPFGPYMLKSTAGKASLDGARVLLRIGTAANTKVRREVVFAGHSQGAHTTLSAAELWKSYAPELPVRAFAVNAPPSGFLEGATYSLTTPGAFGYFVAMRMWSWRRALDTSQPPIFVGTFAQNEEETFKECQNEGQSPGSGTLPDLVPTSAEGVVNPVYIQMARGGANGWAEPWKTWHLENVPRPKALGVPVVVWQGSADSTVLPSETRKYVAELRTGGLEVELREVAGATHNDSVMGPVTLPQAGGEDFVTWMRARFAD
jgi:pimeloyl-ACP methyl ester carboxylesterase